MRIDPDRVPASFLEAAQAVADGLSADELEWLRGRRVDRARPGEDDRFARARQAAVECHHGFGRALRNAWSLWNDATPLRESVRRSFGVTHPDDVSGLILIVGFAYALGVGRTEAVAAAHFQAEAFREHWRKLGLLPDGGPPP